MSMPSFKKKYSVFIHSYVGDADFYDTNVYETDNEAHALFVRDMADSLQGFDDYGEESDVELREIIDHLFTKHDGAMLDLIFTRNPPDWIRKAAKDDPLVIEEKQFEEFVRNVVGHCGEGYCDVQRFPSVDNVKLFKINSVELVD